MANIQKGSKVKFTLAVDGNSMGGSSLKDAEFKVDFYAKESKSSQVTAYHTVNKADATKDAESDNIYYMVCDTATLDLGKISATLEVTYTDTDTDKQVKEIVTLNSDVTIVELQQPAQQTGE